MNATGIIENPAFSVAIVSTPVSTNAVAPVNGALSVSKRRMIVSPKRICSSAPPRIASECFVLSVLQQNSPKMTKMATFTAKTALKTD
jgi:hypothetical protein